MNLQYFASRSPYPGLRPFSGEEAIYYCGRESHVEVICDVLRQNKFLMVAGASGDGKSSLVFAGLVPAMQAGFFKAQYSEFRVASFRPERSPMENFAAALASVLGESDLRSLQARLSYGYSSLVEIFREKTEGEGPGYNLVIYADQFEELFTYPENFRHGKCSAEAQLLVNLLLETARISLEQNLPVYVVCTMRSDYIGQCSSFRGLAEYIGFSHYFVPRLNRLELRQVIEEPAMLNGDDISPRLVERLLYDLEEGNDQLPVLQHALSRIWLLACEQGQSMDLIHYAMAGGMKAAELPEENQAEFQNWLAAQPPELQPVFSRPGLDNVLNLHAEGLLREAVEICRKQIVGLDNPSAIPEVIFRCLTKVDRGRVVRHQISAQELLEVLGIRNLDLLGTRHLNLLALDNITAVFRSPGNTFLRPFIQENAKGLESDSVLDITHESLIRNWDKLAAWTDAEEKDKQTLLDFERQLHRWQESGKSSDYLLPIGPLNQFEGWFEKKKPNAGWLAGLNEDDESREAKLTKAAKLLEAAREFIRKSARHLLLTRTVMKYGANRILLLAGSLVLAFSCLYYYLEYRYKQNDAVIERVLAEGKELMANPNVSKEQKARFAILWERHHGENSFIPLLESLHNDTLAFDVGLEIFSDLNFLLNDGNGGFIELTKKSIAKLGNEKNIHPLCLRLLPFLEQKLNRSTLSLKNQPNQAKRLSQLLMLNHLMGYCTNKPIYLKKVEELNSKLMDDFIFAIVGDSTVKNEKPEIFYAVFMQCLFLSQDNFKLSRIYQNLRDTEKSKDFNRLFPQSATLNLGPKYRGAIVPYLGGKLILQFLAQRNRDETMISSLYMENKKFFSSLYGGTDEEVINIFNAYLFRNSFAYALLAGDGRKFLRTYLPMHQATSLENNPLRLNELIVGFRKKYIQKKDVRFAFHNTSGVFLPKTQHKQALEFLSELFHEGSHDDLEWAEFYKARCFWFDSYRQPNEAKKEADLSLSYVEKIGKNGLSGPDDFFRKKIFSKIFKSSCEYSIYTGESLIIGRPYNFFPSWESKLVSNTSIKTFSGLPWFKEYIYDALESSLATDSAKFRVEKEMLKNVLNFASASNEFSRSDTFKTYACLFELRTNDSLDASFRRNLSQTRFQTNLKYLSEKKSLENSVYPISELVAQMSIWLAQRGYIRESLLFLDKLPQSDKQRAVAEIVQNMNETGKHAEFMPAVLDKAFSAEGSTRQKYPGEIYAALSSTGSSRFIQFGYNLLKEADEFSKNDFLYDIIEGLCKAKMLHQAKEFIPPQSSSSYRMMLLNAILQADEKTKLQGTHWKNLKFGFSYSWNED